MPAEQRCHLIIYISCPLDVAGHCLAVCTTSLDQAVKRWFYADRGTRAVLSVIINDQHLNQGGQPAEVFERALRQLAGIGT